MQSGGEGRDAKPRASEEGVSFPSFGGQVGAGRKTSPPSNHEMYGVLGYRQSLLGRLACCQLCV